MAPTPKILSEFALQSLRFALLAVSNVRRWGDEVVEANPEPPLWAIELACAASDNVHELLEKVPGATTDDLPIKMLCALVLQRFRDGRLSVGDVRGIGWSLHVDGLIQSSNGPADWGVVLECEGEEHDNGWRTIEALNISILDPLRPYETFEKLLPSWAS